MSWGFNKLTCYVTITDPLGRNVARFNHIVGAKVYQSYRTLTDTAEITMPFDSKWQVSNEDGNQTLRIVGEEGEDAVFPHGSAIEVYLGYDFNNKLVFSGYIVGISPLAPFVLYCEDAAWHLKKNNLSFSTRKCASLDSAIAELLKDTGVELHQDSMVNEINFPGGLYVNNLSTAQLLHKWRNEFGLTSFMREGKLMIGRAFFEADNSIFRSSSDKDYAPPTVNIQQDVPRGRDKLELQSLSARSLALKAISMFSTNKRLELTLILDPNNVDEVLIIRDVDTRRTRAEQGQINKDIRLAIEGRSISENMLQVETRHFYSLQREDLIKSAKEALFNYARTGLTGAFTTFGDHNLQPAHSVIIEDSLNKEKRGEYLIQDVNISFGEEGYRQEVTIPHLINKSSDND